MAVDGEKFNSASKMASHLLEGDLLERLSPDSRREFSDRYIKNVAEMSMTKTLNDRELMKPIIGRRCELNIFEDFLKKPQMMDKIPTEVRDEIVSFSLSSYNLKGNDLNSKLWSDFFNNSQSINKDSKYSEKFIASTAKVLGENFKNLESLPTMIDIAQERGISQEETKKQRRRELSVGKLSKNQLTALMYAEKLVDVESLRSIYGGLGRVLNEIHDFNEDSDWKGKTARLLEGFNDKRLGNFFSFGASELYTGNFNLTYQEFKKRVNNSKNGNLEEWAQQEFAQNKMDILAYSILTLSSRRKLLDFYNSGKENPDVTQLKPVCELLGKISRENLSVLAQDNEDEKSKLALSYMASALGELFSLDNQEIVLALKKEVNSLTDPSYFSKAYQALMFSRFKDYFPQEYVQAKERGKQDERFGKVFEIIEYMQGPDYKNLIKKEKGRECLRMVVDFSPSSEGYLKELEKMLLDKKYADRGYCKFKGDRKSGLAGVIKGTMGNVDLEYHLFNNIAGKKFRKLMESGKYSLFFTRHHSYEGNRFLGVGSDNVLPQVSGTRGIGQGQENNALAVVAGEEIAKAYSSSDKSWDKIWQNMEERMNLDNFIKPNDLSFIFSYLAQIKNKSQASRENKSQTKIERPVVFDGGCGGGNRISGYLQKYGKAVNKFLQRTF